MTQAWILALWHPLLMMLSSSKMVVVDAFVPLPRPRSTTTTTTVLHLEDDIANMIDRELHRQQHKKEFEQEWMEQNKEALLHQRRQASDIDTRSNLMLDDDELMTTRQQIKDKRLAENDPQSYCADRCVATGNCDVFEDIYDLTAFQVMQFCEECVLSEEEEPCDLPEGFFGQDDDDDLEDEEDGDDEIFPSGILKP